MVPVPVVALWALLPLLTRADQPPVTVTVTAAIGEDACLPCSPQPWGHLRGVTLSCTHQAGDRPPVPVLSHRLGGHPPAGPPGRFGGRVSFCAVGTGDSGVSLLLRNLSHPDFGNYSCYVARDAAPQLLCSLELQPAVAEAPGAVEPDMLLVVCVLTAAFTAAAIAVLLCARCGHRCRGGTAGDALVQPGVGFCVGREGLSSSLMESGWG
ncbi:uncharacterized protein LOC127463837 [Manacus candei]|uniref:uncharacterized protein LOC127463837 n=1 Tax=Manacus candei TaxID=415023 RepID=UPI0022279A0D|nr:uncharacterized protein LOC127463837 [Manacus candei]